MRVDIEPQWMPLVNWYWDEAGGPEGLGMNIWEMIKLNYGAVRVSHNTFIVEFPDEKMYTMFLLRWS